MGLNRKFILKSTDVLAALKAVDGAGSYLDADLLDGLHASQILSQAQQSVTDLTRYAAAANKIPIGGSNGKLDISWLPDLTGRWANLADFNAHIADETRHTTAAKQANWDSKETPAGAQAKATAAANAALQSAKTYADSLLGNVSATLDSINGEVI